MRKTIFGGFLASAGITGTAVLLAGTMVTGMTKDGAYSFLWSLTQYKLLPFLALMILISVIGLIIGFVGVLEKHE